MTITWRSLLGQFERDACSEEPLDSALQTVRGLFGTVRRARRAQLAQARDPELDPDAVPPTMRNDEIPTTGERIEDDHED